MRFTDGESSVVAGGFETGSSPAHLASADGLAVAKDGTLYIADTESHRIQKWSPGDVVGTTVVGGNGRGNRDDQLDLPEGLFVTEDDMIYVADCRNNQVMKWREGWLRGMVVMGGRDVKGPDQLTDPVDINMDSSGALYTAGGSRVMRWAAPSFDWGKHCPSHVPGIEALP